MDATQILCIAGRFFTTEPPRKPSLVQQDWKQKLVTQPTHVIGSSTFFFLWIISLLVIQLPAMGKTVINSSHQILQMQPNTSQMPLELDQGPPTSSNQQTRNGSEVCHFHFKNLCVIHLIPFLLPWQQAAY